MKFTYQVDTKAENVKDSFETQPLNSTPVEYVKYLFETQPTFQAHCYPFSIRDKHSNW